VDIISAQQNDLSQADTGSRLDGIVLSWLQAKAGTSGSQQTKRKYAQTLVDFRSHLARVDLALDSDPALVLAVVERWAEARDPAPATYNHRLAVLSSFYAYAVKMGYLAAAPALDRIEKRKVHVYGKVSALSPAEAKTRLGKIDTSDLAGQRDYALLLLALTTGRRVAEIAALRRADCKLAGQRVTMTFNRAKGGKQMADTLSPGASRALLTWLQAYYPNLATLAGESPLWVSFSGNSKGKPLSTVSLEAICKKHMSIHFHGLRHTFARTMEDSGAKVSEIQARLGHESLQTTGKYLAALRKADNPYSDLLDSLFGAEGAA
jgi:site-specific recombinase XerD